MSTFVLVHGAFAGKYAWDKVKSLLENADHNVKTFDLPAHGDDITPPGETSFGSYLNTVIGEINAVDEKVVLVGHSMAGVVISAVAENIPRKIDKLVYLSAYLPKSGQSLEDLAYIDAESLIGKNLQFAPDYSGAFLPEAITEEVFAGDCTDEIKQLVVNKSKGRLEPLTAFRAKPLLTEGNFGSVPKYYIETLKDLGVGYKLQQQMVQDNGSVKKVYSLNCGHSAYFALSTDLANILLGLAE